MKARRVRKLDPDAPLAGNAERIVRVRLDELCGFVPAALDPAEVVALHDMRIAAKRLRYLLEVTGFCFGPYASTAVKRAKALQELLGEIHDCDVMLPRVREHIDELREQDVAELLRLAGDAGDLDPAITRQAPNRAAYRGLEVLEVHLQARRELLFQRFLELWQSYERQGFRARLEWALGERPEAEPESADVGVAVAREAVSSPATSLGVPPSAGDDPAATMAAAMDVAAVSGADGAPDEEAIPRPDPAGGSR
jgi:hypothetical protein